MFDFDASCPHCEKKFKVNMVGVEAKEFIRCPHCRSVIKLDSNDPGKKGSTGIPAVREIGNWKRIDQDGDKRSGVIGRGAVRGRAH